jgi:uncharacterized delta-60 repeat protein
MNANYKSIVLAICLLFALSASTSAAPGDLDPTFGNGGMVITGGVSLQLYTAWAMAIQSDGKIVVVGEGATPSFGLSWDFAVVRYNPDGSLDSSFGGTGIVITPVSINYDQATSVAIQSDGKIVVAGASYSSFGVVRYNTDGSLDTSFNGTGKVITSVGSFGGADSVAIQADAKIVVAGRSWDGSTSGFALVRYNSDGSLDTTFNGTGIVVTPGGGAGSVAIESDGKIIVAGSSGNGSNAAFTLVRYNADGTLDTSFNGTGKVITSIGNSGSGASDLAIQIDGKIVAAGYSLTAPDNWTTADFALVRYNPDGSLDTSFGGTGKILIPDSNSGDYADSVAIQPNGKIVVAGSRAIINTSYDFAVVRLNPNGSLDTSFNGTGKVITSVGNSYDRASSVAIQADGKIVVAGETGPDEFKDFVVVRYQGDDATPAACPNPIDCADFFVRQHYLDFLNREPDDAGLAFWTNEITFCGSDAQCVEAKRINVSAAFFLSIEFQNTGYLVERMYKAAYGDATDAATGLAVPIIRRAEMTADSALIGQGVIVITPGWEQQLQTNKRAFALAFVQRQRFVNAYPIDLTAEQFVTSLDLNCGNVLTQEERNALVSELTADGTAMTRAEVLLKIAQNSLLDQRERNRAFVLMQYFGYLRRDPNSAPDSNYTGYHFWLDKLDRFGGDFIQAEMVKAFITSIEYRQRFGL